MIVELTLRPATPTERLYAKRQCIPIMERCGSPGILVAELDDSGTAFYSHWDIWDPAWKTPEFSVELDAMIEMLRSDQRYGPVLKNIPAMIAYCLNNQESRIIQSPEYLFRVDAGYHAYLLRCTPSELLDNAYIYAYRRDLLERHMKEAEKGIRFVTTDGKEKFRVPDGSRSASSQAEMAPVTAPPAISTPATWNCPTSGAVPSTLSGSLRSSWSRQAAG